jgi:hypothetical protein
MIICIKIVILIIMAIRVVGRIGIISAVGTMIFVPIAKQPAEQEKLTDVIPKGHISRFR